MSKPSEQEKYNQLMREINVIQTIGHLLLQGKFSGAMAQDLSIAQMYVQGLHKHLKAEADKMAPLPLPEVNPAAVGEDSGVPGDSSEPSQSANTEAKQEPVANA